MNEVFFIATTEGVLTARREAEHWYIAGQALAAHHVTALSVRDGKILVGTTKGLFHSGDLGRSWRPAGEGVTIQHARWLAYHPDIGGRAFLGTEPAAIFVTTDEAQTWRICPEVAELRDEHSWYLPYSPEAGCVRGFAAHGDRVYAAVEQGGLLRSDDQGATWQPVIGSLPDPRAARPEGFIHPDVHSVLVRSSSPDRVLASTGGGLYFSMDGGAVWEQLYDCYCRAAWMDPQDINHIIFGPADSVDEKGRIERTLDGGKTWSATAIGIQVPWPKHMVERLVQIGPELIAVLSNGHLLSALSNILAWRRILPEVENATSVAVEML
ncbi:MAG: hypothetical protein JXB35_10815 [Anaerolineae bacterium]|nr:hypothetical protein [Anaerolineae bacterium]